MRFTHYRLHFIALIFGVLVISSVVEAKNKKIKAAPREPQDEIQVVGHIPVASGPVRRFLTTQHYSSFYLYAEHDAGKSVTLVDVTKVALPLVLADVAYPSNSGTDSLFAVAGTAALVTEGQAGAGPAHTPQVIRIMDFSDPRNPKVAREFAGVTAVGRDDRRGLIFLANPEGIWILQQSLAEDPEIQKAYAHHVMYDR